jgi:hypothetical protein
VVPERRSQFGDEIGEVRLGHENSGPELAVKLPLVDCLRSLANQGVQQVKGFGGKRDR